MSARGDPTEEPADASGRRPERTGVVVIRIWLESADSARGLRARISLVTDVTRRDSVSLVAGSRDEVLDAVRGFLDDFLG